MLKYFILTSLLFSFQALANGNFIGDWDFTAKIQNRGEYTGVLKIQEKPKCFVEAADNDLVCKGYTIRRNQMTVLIQNPDGAARFQGRIVKDSNPLKATGRIIHGGLNVGSWIAIKK